MFITAFMWLSKYFKVFEIKFAISFVGILYSKGSWMLTKSQTDTLIASILLASEVPQMIQWCNYWWTTSSYDLPQDYTWCFKTSKDILESHIGEPIQLMKYVKIGCDDESETYGYTKRHPNSYSHFYTWKMQVKTNMVLNWGVSIWRKHLEMTSAQRTIMEANNVLSNHNFDTTRTKKHRIANKINNKKEENWRTNILQHSHSLNWK